MNKNIARESFPVAREMENPRRYLQAQQCCQPNGWLQNDFDYHMSAMYLLAICISGKMLLLCARVCGHVTHIAASSRQTIKPRVYMNFVEENICVDYIMGMFKHLALVSPVFWGAEEMHI